MSVAAARRAGLDLVTIGMAASTSGGGQAWRGRRMTGRKARWAQPVCDPELPEALRLLVTEPLAGRQPRREQRWPWRAIAQRELARHSHRVVFPHDLHDDDRIVLARAQLAIQTILSAQVRVEGLVEADEPVLRRHEWDIAAALRDITELRRLHPADPAGSMTAAVLESQRRAVGLAADATLGRVIALERFAGQVAAADDARRDWREALELAGLNDRYLDLVARTAADQLAVAEIDDLTERAAAAARALQDSLRAAGQSAELLALP